MAHSIEARVPMLTMVMLGVSADSTSQQSNESAPRVTADEKIVNGQLKAILREAMKDIVPDKILNRTDKIGFSAPTLKWMRGGLEPWWTELVTSQTFLDRGCFQPNGVVKLIERVENGDAEAASHLWRVAIVEQWARRFLDR